ncbi:titin homolog isoform X1 [Carassius gibelio]|uniref:titin homolog isoform X1 n=1 Tax=Carassius gibelio TaxID=101364 RepID=UPI002279AD55|nr:titin homolog isoform X1 [Carassius gibelio]XP_052423854.1 titin homolog isoform X1 [Carassius gibelio]
MKRRFSDVESPVHLYESSEEERDAALYSTSDGGIEDERKVTLHTNDGRTLCASHGVMEEERDSTLSMTIDGGMEKEIDATLHTTSDRGKEKERDTTLHMTGDGGMEEEIDTTLHMTSDRGMEKERDTTLQMTSDLGLKKEIDTTLHMTSDGGMEEERNLTLHTSDLGIKKEIDTTLYLTSDEGMKKEIDATLHTTSDQELEEERYTTLHLTSDLGIKKEIYTTLHMTSDGGMEEERNLTLHTTSDLGIKNEIDTTLHMTGDGGMEKEKDATLHSTSDRELEEERYTTLRKTSDGRMEKERDTTLHMTDDGGMEEEQNMTLHTTSDLRIKKEIDITLNMTSDGGMEEERNLTLHLTSDEGMEKDIDATLHTTSDQELEEERYTTLHVTSDGGMEEERNLTLHTTSDLGIKKEIDTTLHMTNDEGMEKEIDATLHTTSDKELEEERYITLYVTSDGGMEEERNIIVHTTSDLGINKEIDTTLHMTSDGGMEEETDATLHTTSDGGLEEERDTTLHTTSDGGIEEETHVTLHTTSDEGMEEERDLDGEAELEMGLSDEVSETEDNTEFDPDYHSTDGEESEEESEVTADTETAYQSKNGNISWTSKTPPQRQQGRFPAHRIIRMTPGPTKFACANAKDIISTFELFFPDDIKQILIEMTNLEGKRVFGAAWKNLDWTDLQAFLGLLLLAGVYRSHHEAMGSLWHGVSGRAIFRATMPLKTFREFSRVFCFYKKDEELDQKKSDKLAPVRNIWNKWVQRLPFLYNPGPNVTVDECLVRFRGRCPFKQYMPSKPGKYGIKIWAACDSRSSYAWNLQIYTGKAADGKSEKNQGMRVVLDMTDGLEGHTITCDNFFTSYALGQELLRRKMTMIGTVRSNKPELPPALLSMKNRTRLSSMFAFTDTHTLVSYCPRKNKNVLLMSTIHRDDKVSDKDHKKPEIILDYNHTKGGVDNLDKLVGTYTCQRKTARWPMVIFFNMLDVSAYNAFVLWTEMNPSWHKGKTIRRRLFLEELGEALVAPFMKRRHYAPRTPASQNMVMEARACSSTAKKPVSSPISSPSKRKRCQVCEAKKDTKTSMICSQCNIYICKTHAIITSYCYACKKV